MARRMGIGMVAAMAVLLAAGLAMAQPGGGGGGMGGGPGGGMGGGMGGFDPAEMQRMMDERNQEQLGATPEQWKAIGPKFNAVQTASRSLSSGGMGMGRGMGMGGGRGMGGMGGQQTELDKAREALNTTLDDTAATPEKIQAAVKAFRTAKEAAKKDLTAKQAELKTAIGNNAKMEARLIAMGMLD
jgi:hypothetical protein